MGYRLSKLVSHQPRPVIAPSAIPAKLKNKRATTASSATIPAYASPCSGMSRFTSACSCIGVTTQKTVTAPTPSITVTASQTVSVSKTTSLPETSLVTTTDTTETKTSFTATTTVSSVATVTANKFKLSATYLGSMKYFKIQSAGTNLYYLTSSTTDIASASIFYIKFSGALYSLDNGFQRALAYNSGSGGASFIRLANSLSSATDAWAMCAISDANIVSCSVPTFPMSFDLETTKLSLYRADADAFGLTIITVYAIPIL
ncbi:hypothetical protein ABW20_dc0102435 [Dactylellina cionopaga]|nr:hypothetical protein ABW20_dc0102435 [Dactylellina cionopaga]